eukprot:Stramenopile-MAST_4_protein_2541
MIRGISRHEYYAVVTGRLLVVPYFLSLSRIFPCNINSGTLLFDPTLECGSVPHLIRAAVSLLISMLFFLTYFFYVIDRVKDAVVHRDQERHDKYLRSRQLEYALGITDVYETSGLALCGQFRLVHVAFTPYFDMFKAVFAMQWVILEGWINAVKEAQVLLRDNSIIPKELVRVDLLKKFASILRTAWLEASSRSSFGANGGHLLALTLYEHLQQIIAMRQVNKLHSFYPRQDLGHDNMAHMAQMANISKRKFILVDPRLKGVVRKLVAVRAWFTIGIGKTSIPPILVNNEERESSFK